MSAFTPFSALGYQSTPAGARRPSPQHGRGADPTPVQGLSLPSSGGASLEQTLVSNLSRQSEAGPNLPPRGGPSAEANLSPVNQVWKDPYRDDLLAEIMRAEESVNVAEKDLLSVYPALQRDVVMRKEKLQDETDLVHQRRRRSIFLIEIGRERIQRYTDEFKNSYYPDMRLAYPNAGPWYNDAIALMEQTEFDPNKRLRVFSEQLQKLKNIPRPNEIQKALIREYQQIIDKEQRIVAQGVQLQCGLGPSVQIATARRTAGSGGARPPPIQTGEHLNTRLGTLATGRRSFSFPTNLGRGTVDDASGPQSPRLGWTQASNRPIDPVTAGRNNLRADNPVSSIGQPRNTISNPAAGSDASLYLMAGRGTAQTAQGHIRLTTSRQTTAQPAPSRIITTGTEAAVAKPRTGSADAPMGSSSRIITTRTEVVVSKARTDIPDTPIPSRSRIITTGTDVAVSKPRIDSADTTMASSPRIVTTGKDVAVSKPRTVGADTPMASASIPPVAGASLADMSLGRAGSPRTGSVATISSPRSGTGTGVPKVGSLERIEPGGADTGTPRAGASRSSSGPLTDRVGSPRTGSVPSISSPRPGTGIRVPRAGSSERLETGGADAGIPRAGPSRSSSGTITDPALWSLASRSSSMSISDTEQPTTPRSDVPETSKAPTLDPSAVAAASAQPGTSTKTMQKRQQVP